MPESKRKERCRLYEKNGIEAWCTREKCVFWRLLESQDIDLGNEQGCGLQHFHIYEKVDQDTAEWLLSMKKRLENLTPEVGKSRISFRRREEK